MLSHRKFLRMTRAERGDWLTLVLAAINSTKDDDLGTRDDCISILRSYGNARPADTIAQFVNLRLLDERIDDGHLLLHDWADHQPDDPTGEKRKAAERAAAKAGDVRGQSRDSHATVAGHSADSPEPVRGMSNTLSRESRSRDGEERRGDREKNDPPPPAKRGRRKDGTNPRATGEAPRDVGANPRANGTSPRQEREAEKRGPTSLGDILRETARQQGIDAPAWLKPQPEKAEVGS